MLDLLASRFGGKEWVFIRKARDAAGFDASRTFDAIAFNVWPSRGLVLVGFEVKVDRSDWLRELATPAKAEGALALVDRWYVSAPKGIVKPSELPRGWGLLEASEKRLTETVVPTSKTYSETVDRSLMGAMFKNLCDETARRYAKVTPDEDVEARASTMAEGRVKQANEWSRREIEKRERFEKASGIHIDDWRGEQIGDAVRVLMNGGVTRAIEELERTEDQYRQVLETVQRSAAALRKHVVSGLDPGEREVAE